MIKFFWYWLRIKPDALSCSMLKLNDLQEVLLDELFVETQIDKNSVNYEKNIIYHSLGKLDGIDLKKSFDTYVS